MSGSLGVCCFPYGELLDKICVILEKAERMMNGEFDVSSKFFFLFSQNYCPDTHFSEGNEKEGICTHFPFINPFRSSNGSYKVCIGNVEKIK